MNTYIILGMHRSATSFIAKALKEQGVAMGERLLGPGKGNPAGHFENLLFLELNEAILRAAGGTWDRPPEREAILNTAPTFAPIIERLVRSQEHELWGWKDPRTSLTIDLYTPYLTNPFFIVCFRRPTDVAGSLKERDGISLKRGLALAREYNRRLLDFLRRFTGV